MLDQFRRGERGSESALSPEKLHEFKKQLMQEKARLEAQLSTFADKNPKDPENFEARMPQFGSDEDENASEVTAYEDARAVEAKLESQLRDVSSALARLEEGAYGICKYCQKPIPEARLNARPESSSCVNCKESVDFKSVRKAA